MKNSRILNILAAVALTIVTASCEDFLTREPKLSQSTEITLTSYTGLNNATFGAYIYLSSTDWYGQGWVINSEMRSGNGKKESVDGMYNSNRCVQPYIWNYNPDATSGFWSTCYLTVAMCNNVIDNLEGKATGDVTEQDLNNLKAECLFIRAFAHFCNVLTYGQPYTYCKSAGNENLLGVPYIYHTDPAGKPARETVISNYENVVKDLLEAESIIDPKYVRKGPKDPNATVNISTIQALLSRVYLYMGEWQKAADYATKVIESKKYRLWDQKEYTEIWGQDLGTGEVILEVYGAVGNSTNGNWEDISYLTNPAGSADPQAAKPLLDLYEEGDVRLKTYRTDAEGTSGIMWTAKYPGKGIKTPDVNNVVVIRLSEMYLNRAEAIINGAVVPGVTAKADLDAITNARGASEYAAPGKLDVQIERRKELAWEGHYLYDLARWGKSVERSEADYPLCTENLNVPFPSNKWALPLPKSELDVNGNLEQNPL